MPLPVLKNTNSNTIPFHIAGDVTIWTGNTNSSFNNGRNWTGVAPVNDSSAYIVNSNVDITGGDFQSTSLKQLRIGPSYTGNIGTPGTPLKVMAETLVIDNRSSSINIRGSFRDIHIINGSNRIRVGGSQTRSLQRLMIHGNGLNFDIYGGQCNRLIVSGNGNKITAPEGVTNDNLLASIQGFDEIRCASGSTVSTRSGVNKLTVGGEVQVKGQAILGNTKMLPGSRIITESTGSVALRLTMFGGTFDVRNSSTGEAFVINNADLFSGRMFSQFGETGITFSNNANVLGPFDFQLKSGSTLAVS